MGINNTPIQWLRLTPHGKIYIFGVKSKRLNRSSEGKNLRRKQCSTGVSFFEQFVWDLEKRGVSDIDIPVLIYGIDSTQSEKQKKLWIL